MVYVHGIYIYVHGIYVHTYICMYICLCFFYKFVIKIFALLVKKWERGREGGWWEGVLELKNFECVFYIQLNFLREKKILYYFFLFYSHAHTHTHTLKHIHFSNGSFPFRRRRRREGWFSSSHVISGICRPPMPPAAVLE